MPTASTSRPIRPESLLRQIEELPFATLNKLMPKIEALRRKKHPRVLSTQEARLIKLVQAGFPSRLLREKERLTKLRDDGLLKPADRTRMSDLVNAMDAHQLKHLEALIQLAALRKTTVPSLVKLMGLPKS